MDSFPDDVMPTKTLCSPTTWKRSITHLELALVLHCTESAGQKFVGDGAEESATSGDCTWNLSHRSQTD